VLSVFYLIVDFIVVNLRPPAGSSARTIRISGAVTAALGIVLLALTVGGVALLVGRLGSVRTPVWVTTPFWLTGFAATIVGAFRLLLAADPDEMSAPKRMALGVVFGCGSLFLVFALVIVIAIILQHV
jgi:flagellar biogenesis protein FliO